MHFYLRYSVEYYLVVLDGVVMSNRTNYNLLN